MWLYLFNVIVLIDLTTCGLYSMEFASKEGKISKPFDLKAFNGTWFEAAIYHTILVPPKLEHWPGVLAYCPTWHFSVKPGKNPTEMDVTYYTTSVKDRHPMTFTGRITLKSSRKIKRGAPMYKMDLYPSEHESLLSSGKVHVDFAVIDTDYDTYAFIYMIEYYALLEPRESVIGLSRYQRYAKNFKRDWMIHAVGTEADYFYNFHGCKQALPEDKPLTQSG